MKNILFLQWHLVFTFICVISIILYQCGIAKEIWIKDSSFLSYITFGIFLICSLYAGKLSYSLGKVRKNTSYYKNKSEIGWFVSELCLTLGMMGTIVGFIMMLTGFNSLDIQNITSVQSLLSQLGGSMATALYTTIVGLVCGSILKLQFFLIALEIDKIESKINEDK